MLLLCELKFWRRESSVLLNGERQCLHGSIDVVEEVGVEPVHGEIEIAIRSRDEMESAS